MRTLHPNILDASVAVLKEMQAGHNLYLSVKGV
jgi:hypothetical protein